MPTVVSHAVAAVALIAAFPKHKVPRRLAVLGAACSMVPDLDVLGFAFGVHYADLLGHRGLTHSLGFAAVFAFVSLLAASRARRRMVWLYLFLATASHGLLDAFTNGGLGVAFFSPFDTTRYFFPFTPIMVCSIGGRFFSARGVAVLLNEIQWVWFPSIVFAVAACLLRRFLSPRMTPDDQSP